MKNLFGDTVVLQMSPVRACVKCKKILTDDERVEIASKRKMAVCDDCQKLLDQALKKWGPKFATFKF